MRKVLWAIFLVGMCFCLTISVVQGANEPNLKDKVEGIPVTEVEVEGLEVTPVSYTVKLGSGYFTPSPGVHVDKSLKATNMTDAGSVYCLIQFYQGNCSMDDYYYIKKSGVKVLSYVPENTYYAKVPLAWLDTPPSFVRWIGTLNPEQKVDSTLKKEIDIKPLEKQNIAVTFFEPLTGEDIELLKEIGVDTEIYAGIRGVLIPANRTKILELANLNFVKMITKEPKNELLLDRSAHLISADMVWAKGNTGSGVTVGIIDTGIQHTHPHFAGPDGILGNADDRVTIYDAHDYYDGDEYPEADANDHGVHVAGIVSGSGVYDDRRISGISNETNLVIERVAGLHGFRWPGASSDEIWREILDNDGDGDYFEDSSADIISCSWVSYIEYGAYEEASREVDRVVKGELGREVPVVLAAGNDHQLGIGAIPPSTAKNAITVGACADYRSSDTFCQHIYPPGGRAGPDGRMSYDANNEYVME
ncbi:hypothetical protein CW714_02685 [Methanophagales archaeon]|nr:MAG: hypothetical protein CW714_02685 [Methanophagales archaeon]